jgi:hypothetical protein
VVRVRTGAWEQRGALEGWCATSRGASSSCLVDNYAGLGVALDAMAQVMMAGPKLDEW